MNQHSVKIEVNQEIIDPYYLCCFLNSELCKTQMDREVTGGTRPALDYSAIKKLLILYPKELETQEEIAKLVYKIVDDAYSKLERRNKILSELDEIVLEKLGIELPEEYAKKCFEVNPYFETIS